MKPSLQTVVWIVSATLACVTCRKEPVNQAPVADFIITPDSGDTETVFNLDARPSFDPDGADTALEVRWDYENDGIYDRLWLKTRVNPHRFPTSGMHTIRLQVRDLAGATSSVTRDLWVSPGNAPPLVPFSPNPRDSSNHILFNGRLSWVAVDPDEDSLTYDIYLGTDENPHRVVQDHPRDEYYPGNLVPGQKYFWKVVARDPGGMISESPLWRFSIHSGQYTRDTLTDPRDGQRYPIVKINRVWWMTRNLNYATTYSFCYDHDAENCEAYGRLYFIYLADSLKCPKGWTVPSDELWTDLEHYLGTPHSDFNVGWYGNDQAYQMLEGGTSGLDLQFAGYATLDQEGKFIRDKAFYSTGSYMRMFIRNHGQVYRNSRYTDNFREVMYTPVRCVRRD